MGRYGYQIESRDVLIRDRRKILAIGVGGGKSVVALDAAQRLNCKRVMVLCLNSLKNNWEAEINKWYPAQSVSVVKSNSTVAQRDYWIEQPADYCVISFNQIITVTKYETITMPDGYTKRIPIEVQEKNVPTLLRQNWDCLIIDEAHTLRGRQSKALATAKKLAKKIPNVFLLTGTPIWSDAVNYFPLLKIIDPVKFSNFWKWAEIWFNSKINYFSKNTEFTTVKDFEAFRSHIEPYMLSYPTEIVQKELPPVTFIHLPVELLPKQQKQYDTMKKKMRLELDSNREVFVQNAGGLNIKLRQICISTDLLNTPEDYDTGVADPSRFDGAKIDCIMDLLESFPKEDKTVIFSTWATPIWRLLPLVQKKYEAAAFTGKTPNGHKGSPLDNSTRWGIIKRLQEGDLKVMLISTAGSIGGTYTAANRFIFLNSSYVPAENAQAYGRIARITQKKPCFVYNIYAKDTIEEKILQVNSDREWMFKEATPVSEVTEALLRFIESE